MSPQALEIIAGSSGEFDFIHAYSFAYAVGKCNRELQETQIGDSEKRGRRHRYESRQDLKLSQTGRL
jgi:hypothetical protein